MAIDIRQIVSRLRTLDSLAVLSRVSSTNAVGRRVAAECIDNDIPLPSAMIVAREQLAGEGRQSRSWHSPAMKGIYSTTLHSRKTSEIDLLPLEIGTAVATFLRDTYAVDARIKWPNDVLVGDRKIAGILIEARIHNGSAYIVIGVGINIEADLGIPANATSVAEASGRDAVDLDSATTAFIESIDRALSDRAGRDAVLALWRKLSVHQPGDLVSCNVGDSSFKGIWAGIDDEGRALLRKGEELIAISAGDIILR
jgi:BirA family transcriptional regulator, biotin operon repressor / biotin---[acetyl-CoA-carboxylase] ligase